MFEVGHFRAGDNIRPGVVVRIDSPYTVITATSRSDRRIIGVAAVWTARPQGFQDWDYAARTGELIQVYQRGQVGLALVGNSNGNSVNAGDLLVLDTGSNNGVSRLPNYNAAGNSAEFVVLGHALESGSPNEYIRFVANVFLVETRV